MLQKYAYVENAALAEALHHFSCWKRRNGRVWAEPAHIFSFIFLIDDLQRGTCNPKPIEAIDS